MATHSSIFAWRIPGTEESGGLPTMRSHRIGWLKWLSSSSSSSKEPACQCRRASMPGSGKSPGGGHGNPFQYSGLGNPMERGTWWDTVHGLAKRQTRLNRFSMHVCVYKVTQTSISENLVAWNLKLIAIRLLKPYIGENIQEHLIVVQSSSHVWFLETLWPWTAARQGSLFFTISQSLPKFMFIASVMPSSHLILWCCLLLLPSLFPSIREFSSELSVYIRWLKYWSFSFSNRTSSEYSELISLKIDWFDLLAVQGTFRSLLQNHSLKASILWHSAFFMVQLSQLYMTTGKTMALTIWTFVGRVISLFFNRLSRFVIIFLPRGSCFLILCLYKCQFMTVIFFTMYFLFKPLDFLHV